jgi:hypothetical protein
MRSPDVTQRNQQSCPRWRSRARAASPSGLAILLVVRIGCRNIVWIRAINAAPTHLVPQERDNRDDHHSSHQERWREYAQVLHQADAPFAGPAGPPCRGRWPAQIWPAARGGLLGGEAAGNPATGIGGQDPDSYCAVIGRLPCTQPDGLVATSHILSSMRVLPSVLGFTRSRSRNSATPSSYERSSSAYTSGVAA